MPMVVGARMRWRVQGADVRRRVSLRDAIRMGQFWSRYVMSRVEVDDGTA